jgi:gamma-glutamyltranspeptidase/glutathione hydrolase
LPGHSTGYRIAAWVRPLDRWHRRRFDAPTDQHVHTSARRYVHTSTRQLASTLTHVLALLLALAFAAPAAALTGRHGMVAAEHRLAAQAGLRILQQGGNAVDAAVATALAVGVVNPTSCGIGGGGFMLIFDRAAQRVAALDYRERAPAAAERDMFVRDGAAVAELSRRGGLAVAVPGEIAGLFAALRRHGTRSFAAVAAPAIAYARDGFTIEVHLAEAIAEQLEAIRARPPLARILLHPDGRPLAAGETLRQPDLARSLEAIAAGGAAVFYTGSIATAIATSVRDSGGVLTRADLEAYRPLWRRPLSARFDGYTFFSMPPPSSGGGVLITVLNQLRRDDLRALAHNSPTYLHLLAEALQFGFADRARAYGDPDVVNVPLATMLAAERGRQLRRRIGAATTHPPGWYGEYLGASDAGTSHLSVVDGDGNAVACTTSINTSFGSLVVAGDTGIILNNTMDDFSAQPGAANAYGLIGSQANAIAPGKRPLSSMTPTIVTRHGAVVAVAGGSGGPFIITATLQVLLNALVFGADAEQAVAAPRLHHQWIPPVLMLEPGIGAGERSVLTRLGHRIVDAPPAGAVQLVLRAPDGALHGAADRRKGGQAAGW